MIRNLPKGFLILLVLTVFVNMGIGIVVPILPNLIIKTTNSVAALSFPFLTLIIFRIISKPFAGYIIDKIGAVRVLQIMFLLFGLSFVLYPLADSLVMFSSIRCIEGIAEGIAAVVLLETALLLSKDRKDSGFLMGLFSASFGIGYIFGPAIGSLLYIAFEKNSMFYFGMTASLIGVTLATSLPRIDKKKLEKQYKKDNFYEKKDNLLKFVIYSNKYLIPFIPQILRRVVFFSLMMLIPLYAVDVLSFDVKNVGWIFTLSACITTVLMPIFGSLSDKYNPKKIVFFGLLVMSSCFLSIALTNSAAYFVLAIVIETVAFSAMLPAGMKVFSHEAQNEDKRPAIMGLFGSYIEIATLILSVALPLLYSTAPSVAWMLLCVICFVSAILFSYKQQVAEKRPVITELAS